MSDASKSIASDMVAVYDGINLQWWIYFISTEGEIRFFQGPIDGQLEDTKNSPPYVEDGPNLDAAKKIPGAKAGNPQLGVCEYLDNSGNPQVTLLR